MKCNTAEYLAVKLVYLIIFCIMEILVKVVTVIVPHSLDYT